MAGAKDKFHKDVQQVINHKRAKSIERCPPKARVKLAGVKSEAEGILEYNGLRAMRVALNAYTKLA